MSTNEQANQIQDVEITTSELFDRNFERIINSFDINPEELNVALKNNNGMISGGLSSKCLTEIDINEIDKYDGDLDLWIPLCESSSLEEYMESFDKLKDYREIENKFKSLFVGYEQKLIGDVELYEIGRSLAMYKDHKSTIKRLKAIIDRNNNELIKEQIEIAIKTLEADDVVNIENNRKRVNFNNENLKILFSKDDELVGKIKERQLKNDNNLNDNNPNNNNIDNNIVYNDSLNGFKFCHKCEKFHNNNIKQFNSVNNELVEKLKNDSINIDCLKCKLIIYRGNKTELLNSSLNKKSKKQNIDKMIDDYNTKINNLEIEIATYENSLNKLDQLSNDAYYKERLGFDKIFTISRFKKGNKEIQLIFTFIPHAKMLQLFDLIFCGVGWDGKNIHCIAPELTKSKIGFKMNYRSFEREKARAEKYISRGYKIYETKEEALLNFNE